MKPEDMLLPHPSPGDHPKRYFPGASTGTPPRSLGARPGSREMVQERFRSCLLRIKAPSKPRASSHKRRIRDEPDHMWSDRDHPPYDESLARESDCGARLGRPRSGLPCAAGCPPCPPGPTPRGGGGGPWGATAAPSPWHLLRGLGPTGKPLKESEKENFLSHTSRRPSGTTRRSIRRASSGSLSSFCSGTRCQGRFGM